MKKSKAEKLDIYSVVHLENVKGYIFVETTDENTLVKLIQKVKHVKGFLKTHIEVSEIEKLIAISKQPPVALQIGDMIEMTSGPFKGERAKILKIDEGKDEVTVELVEVAVPIPVTVKTKMVKLLSKNDDQN